VVYGLPAPKKLRVNWTLYTLNDKRNLFTDDRFNYDVLNHTDLTRDGGFPPLREINREIRRLNLAAYASLKYLLPEKRDEYAEKYDTQVAQGGQYHQNGGAA